MSRTQRELCERTLTHQRLAARAALVNLFVNGWNTLPLIGKRFPVDWGCDPCPLCGAELP